MGRSILATFQLIFISSPSRGRPGGFWWIHDHSWPQTGVFRRSRWFSWKHNRQHILAGESRLCLKIRFDSKHGFGTNIWLWIWGFCLACEALFWAQLTYIPWTGQLSWDHTRSPENKYQNYTHLSLGRVKYLPIYSLFQKQFCILEKWDSPSSGSQKRFSWRHLGRTYWYYLCSLPFLVQVVLAERMIWLPCVFGSYLSRGQNGFSSKFVFDTSQFASVSICKLS